VIAQWLNDEEVPTAQGGVEVSGGTRAATAKRVLPPHERPVVGLKRERRYDYSST
jgi:hypothetical protein